MSETAPGTNGWNEWSQHVLKALERLDEGVKELGHEFSEIHREIVEIKTNQDSNKIAADEVKAWKKEMSEVVSPTQLKEKLKDVDDLKAFKAKAMAFLIIGQAIIGIAMVIIGWYL